MNRKSSPLADFEKLNISFFVILVDIEGIVKRIEDTL